MFGFDVASWEKCVIVLALCLKEAHFEYKFDDKNTEVRHRKM